MKKCKSLRIEESTVKRIENIARHQNRSFNNMVEVILQGYATFPGKDESPPSFYSKEPA